MNQPELVLLSPSTEVDPSSRTVGAIARAFSARRPFVPVRIAYRTHGWPLLSDAVDRAAVAAGGVVVPLAVALGRRAEAELRSLVGAYDTVTHSGALGPDPALTGVLLDRLVASGAVPGDHVVLALVGSDAPTRDEDAELVRRAVARRWEGPVSFGFTGGHGIPLAEAIERARRRGSRVVVAPYLLGAGEHYQRALCLGGDITTRPLGCSPTLVTLVEQRYDIGVQRLARLLRMPA